MDGNVVTVKDLLNSLRGIQGDYAVCLDFKGKQLGEIEKKGLNTLVLKRKKGVSFKVKDLKIYLKGSAKHLHLVHEDGYKVWRFPEVINKKRIIIL